MGKTRALRDLSQGSHITQSVKNLPAMQETWVPFLGKEDTLEKEMATHSSILAWRIPRTEVQENWDTKGAFHAKVGTIKDRNGKDLTGAEEIEKWWQEYTEELYKEVLMIQITMTVWLLT